MDGNRPKKQKFIPFKLKNTKGVSTSNNTSVSNVFEVLGDLEDDGHLDAHTEENLECRLFFGIRFHVSKHFDLFTKEDGKIIFLNLRESDDDADVENSCDDTATSSKSLGSTMVTLHVYKEIKVSFVEAA
ncbi:hypothetical protein Tco_0144549 [Tanacetum coccineum]